MDAPEKKPDHHKASSSSSSRRHEPMDTSDDSTPTTSGSSTRHASATSGTPKQSRESRKASTTTAAASGASSSASSSSQSHQQQPHIEYGCVGELVHEFRQCMRDPRNVDTAAEYLYESLLDEMVLGVAFEMHYSHRTGILQALEGQAEDPRQNALVSNGGPDIDVFGANCTKIAMDCTCPKCDRSVAAARFAPHLEKCMGMGRISSRIASRRLASTRDGGGNYFGSVQSDDEDDADWSGEKRKKKVQPVRTNGSKKNGKSSS